MTNKLFNYLFHFMISSVFCSGASCQIEEIFGDYKRIPVYSKSLFDISQGDPRLENLKGISHAYASSRDSFVITLFDMGDNISFVNSDDVVVVSTLKDSLAPIIPDFNSNAAFFKPGLVFDYFGTKYKLITASSDGRHISIEPLLTNIDFETQIIVTDQVSNELITTEINSTKPNNLLNTLQAQNKKYVLLYFWSPYCPPCFENIPMLKIFESSGIGIINIFFMDDDEITLVEKQISRFDIPGINFRSSPELRKYFSQNGFPYSVLVDVPANKILSSANRIAEHEKYID